VQAVPENSPPSLVFAEVARGEGLRLEAIAARIPSLRHKRPVSSGAIWNWITKGVETEHGRIVRLEAVRSPSGWLSTEAALRRFLQALTVPQEESCASS
jgi:hypothetical protein